MSMHRALLHTALATAAVLTLIAGQRAEATSQRTFVSTSGADNPSCSLVSPCRTFGAAVTATNAGGEVIVLDSGGYGTVTITKSVSIIAPPGIYAGISVPQNGDGVTIGAPGATVVLRGLSINGIGGNLGINVLQAARVRIETCAISNMSAHGLQATAVGAEVVVLDSIVRDNNADGIIVAGALNLKVDGVRLLHNLGNGLHADAGATVTATNIVSSGNGQSGVLARAPAANTTTVVVATSVLSDNGVSGARSQATHANGCVKLTVSDSKVARQTNGIDALSPATLQDPLICQTFAMSDNNLITENSFGLATNGSVAAFIITRQNNSLVFNSNDIVVPGPNLITTTPK